MRIIHVIGSMGSGGAQSLLVDLIRSQKDLGLEVSLVELNGDAPSVFRKPLIDSGINICTVGDMSVYNPLCVLRVKKFLKDADIVHVHLFPALYWVALAKSIFGGHYKLVYTEHSTNNKRRESYFWRCFDRLIYKKYDSIVACSDNAKESFDIAFPKLKCVSIPNGIDLERFRKAMPYSKQDLWGIDDNAVVSVMVARFEYPKRQEVIVNALKYLPDRFHCSFVGGNEDDSGVMKVKSLAESIGVINRVHFLFTRSDVPRILKTSDFIVLSSDYEGLSLSMIEGMSVGKPFIASEAPGLKDLVMGSGLLFKCGDSKQLATILRELDVDKKMYNSVAEACNNKASEFDIVSVTKRYISVYHDLICS